MNTLKSIVVGLALGYGALACGPDSVNNYYGAGKSGSGTNSSDSDFCGDLCARVWLDCDGLPTANYRLGSSYADCIDGCPGFLGGVNNSPNANKMNTALQCMVYGDNQHVDVSCSNLAKDTCGMDEGNLFSKY